MADTFELETDNTVHGENVSDHTLRVVNTLKELKEYNDLDKINQDILNLAAYLHDIGKGPKSKWSWNKGIQKAYPDHPADAVPMLKRILVEEFEILSKEEIRKICLLVVYHDLVGDIIGKGRDIQQIMDLIKDEDELDLLIALSIADVESINKTWMHQIRIGLTNFKKKVIAELQ